MKIQMLITADAANIDTTTGKINILGAFNRIFSRQFPAVHPRIAVIVKLAAASPMESTDIRNFEGVLVDADGIELHIISGPVSIARLPNGTYSEVGMVLELNGIVFSHPGFYQYVIRIDGEEIGETSIELVLLEQ